MRKTAILAGFLLAASPCLAVLDIEDRGPVLSAGDWALRVTNAGILGNAFYDRGLSFDPSLEYPRGSGHEALNHAELWVGAVTADGRVRVSGGKRDASKSSVLIVNSSSSGRGIGVLISSAVAVPFPAMN